jgi:hypothetical protein
MKRKKEDELRMRIRGRKMGTDFLRKHYHIGYKAVMDGA